MDMDQDLDEFKGDVDFDFFDDDSKGKSPSPYPGKGSKVEAKPPPAPKSPKPDSPVNYLRDSEKVTGSTSVNGDNSGKDKTSKTTKHDESDSYSSDSDQTESESETSSFSDVSSVRSGTRARNRSRSQSSSYSRSPTPERKSSKPIIKSRKRSTSRERDTQKSRHRSESFSSSSSSESDSDSDRTQSPTPRQKKRNDKQSKHVSHAPVHREDGKPVSSKARPVSAHPRKRQNGVQFEAWGNERNNKDKSNDVKHKNKSENNRNSKKNNRLGSESDSDMTDVSPLTSPRNSPNKHKRDSKTRDFASFPVKSLKKTVQYRQMPLDDIEDDGNFHYPHRGEGETLDLNILMKAVSELEKKKRVKDNSRRVMFAPARQNERGNYTFSDDRTKVIERENQRLLNEIMKHVAEQREPHRVRRVEPPPVRRLTASAINRQRQQRQIESENMALLRRLQHVRPTRGMARNEQIDEYQRTLLYGVPIAAADELKMKSSRRSRPGSAGSTLSQRSRSMSSVHSASTITSEASTVRSGRRSGSAKKFRPVDTRPDWSERW